MAVGTQWPPAGSPGGPLTRAVWALSCRRGIPPSRRRAKRRTRVLLTSTEPSTGRVDIDANPSERSSSLTLRTEGQISWRWDVERIAAEVSCEDIGQAGAWIAASLEAEITSEGDGRRYASRFPATYRA